MYVNQISVIPGDGIGREVIPPTLDVIQAVGRKYNRAYQFHQHDWGSEYYLQHGCMMPQDALERLSQHPVILLGAVGHPAVPDHITLQGLLLPIRRAFDQYANVRPAYLFPGVASPLAGKAAGDIDMVIVRENTEGEYTPAGGFAYRGHPNEIAIQTSVFTRAGIDRVVRFAFDLAMQRGKKKKITSITKSNAQAYSLVLWDEVFQTAARDYPEIQTESLLVDAAAMAFVRRPESFDVVVGSNLFADILSDLSAAITGSIGLAPSANINPPRNFPAMFEPVHGSAPDIAGKGIANPLGAILSGAMMLDYLGHHDAAADIARAVLRVLSEGKVRTPDLGGRGSTREVAEAVLSFI
jgi:tartrate dehydrogenase/decarboxylase/D-malate dehydrogenase